MFRSEIVTIFIWKNKISTIIYLLEIKNIKILISSKNISLKLYILFEIRQKNFKRFKILIKIVFL